MIDWYAHKEHINYLTYVRAIEQGEYKQALNYWREMRNYQQAAQL